MTIEHSIPVLGFAAYSGTGKTTLLEKLIPLLKARSIKVALIKHAHHDVDVDTPGKDTYRLRHAGANPVLLATRKRWALMVEEEDPQEDRAQEFQAEEVFDREQVEGRTAHPEQCSPPVTFWVLGEPEHKDKGGEQEGLG